MEDDKKHKGLRFNEGKLRYDLVHPWSHEQMVKVLTKGAIKYESRNWERGMKWSTVIASLKRHLIAIENGEDFDPETGELHIAHVACNAHFLTAYYKIYPQGDDRPHDYLSKPRIGLDIDEVICDFMSGWSNKFNIERPSNWYFDSEVKDKISKMRDDGELEDFYMSLDPLINPQNIPFEPHCYITARPIDSTITEQWLIKHGFPIRPIYTVGIGGDKVKEAKQQDLDIFVDDNFKNFTDMNNAGICTFLMDAKHNQRYDVGFKRLKNLKDLL